MACLAAAGRGRWRVEGEAQWRATEQARVSEVLRRHSHIARDSTVRGAVSYGVTGRLQVSARAYRHTPFSGHRIDTVSSTVHGTKRHVHTLSGPTACRLDCGADSSSRGRRGHEVGRPGSGEGTEPTPPRCRALRRRPPVTAAWLSRALDGRWDKTSSGFRPTARATRPCVWTRPSIPPVRDDVAFFDYDVLSHLGATTGVSMESRPLRGSGLLGSKTWGSRGGYDYEPSAGADSSGASRRVRRCWGRGASAESAIGSPWKCSASALCRPATGSRRRTSAEQHDAQLGLRVVLVARWRFLTSPTAAWRRWRNEHGLTRIATSRDSPP